MRNCIIFRAFILYTTYFIVIAKEQLNRTTPSSNNSSLIKEIIANNDHEEKQKRMLSTDTNYSIKFDYSSIMVTSNGMTADISAYLKDVTQMTSYYFSFMIMGDLTQTITTATCGTHTIPSSPVSFTAHLVIMVDFKNEPLNSIFLTSDICQRDGVTNKPLLGLLTYNIAAMSSLTSNYNFKQDTKVTSAEIIRIFGFRFDQLQEWLDPTSTTIPKSKYGASKLNTDMTYNQTLHGFVDNLFLKTPFISQTVKDYFNCKTQNGLQMENQQLINLQTQYKLSIERTILYNEALTSNILQGESIFSIFTGAILKDMGYFNNVNFNFLDDITFGQGKGCDFLSKVCKSSTQYQEFSYIAQQQCDFYGQGIGQNTADQYVDPGCQIPQLTQQNLCDQSISDPLTRQIGGQNSRCLPSSSIQYLQTSPLTYTARCHEIICSSDYQTISIRLLANQQAIPICTSNQKGKNVNLYSFTMALPDKTSGFIQCPSDYKQFCLTPSKCPNYCSRKGFCIRNNCICLPGYANTDCSKTCPASTPYWDTLSAACVSLCPVNQYINPNNTCQRDCPRGYYGDSNSMCKQCHVSCRECSGGLANNCISCNYPYIIDVTGTICSIKCNSVCNTCFGTASNQCFSCISGYYLSGMECKQCISPCKTCTSDVNCSTCIANYTYNVALLKCNPICHSSCVTCSEPLSASSCLTCVSSMYLSSSNQCIQCSSACQQCTTNADNCTLCYSGYDLFNNKCYPRCLTNCKTCSTPTTCQQCHDKYFWNGTSCQLCIQTKCLQCVNSSVCLDCSFGYYLNGAGQCIQINNSQFAQYQCLTSQSTPIYQCLTCNTGYFIQNNQCSQCNANCYDCLAESTKCTSCNSHSQLVPGQSKCQLVCHVSCLTCSVGMSSTKCNSCQPGYVLNGVAPNSCLICTSPCKTCYGIPSNCQSCIQDYTLTGSTCNPDCDSSCQTCSTPKSATSCLSCASGFYLSQNECLACSSPCASCVSTDTQCTSCIANYTLLGIQCQPNCDSSCLTCDMPQNSRECLSCRDGYYLETTNQCLPCDTTTAKCGKCVSMPNYCTSCQNNYSLIGSTCQPNCYQTCAQCNQPILLSQCTVCNDGYFETRDVLNQFYCQQCRSPCKQCVTNQDKCLSCIDNYTYDNINFICIESCDVSCATCTTPLNNTACTLCAIGYFRPANSNICQKCTSNCNVCDKIPENCSQCKTGYVIKNGICVFDCDPSCRECVEGFKFKCTSCQNNKYLNVLSFECLNCNSPCLLCSSGTDCITCQQDYEFVPASLKCLPICDVSCVKNSCSIPRNANACLSCYSNYFLSTTTQPITGIINKQCIQCQSPCQECTNTPTQCTTCIPSYKIYLQTCIPDCGNHCHTCTDPLNSNTCTECDGGYYLDISVVGSNIIRQCLNCTSPCLNCLEKADTCMSCQINYSLNGNMCLPICHLNCKECNLPNNMNSCTSCKVGYYLVGGQCLQCAQPCLECTASSTNCLTCVANYYLNPRSSPTATLYNECLPKCDPTCTACKTPNTNDTCKVCVDGKYLDYVDAISGRCLNCKDECKLCTTLTLCTECQPNYQLNAATQQCIPSTCHRTCAQCSIPYNQKACTQCYSDSWLSINQCISCKYPCKTCSSSSTNCTSCASNYSLSPLPDLTNTCTPICDPSCLTCSLPFSATSCLTCRSPNYVLSSSNTCVQCISSCSACKGTIDNCQTCNTGYQLTALYPNNGLSQQKTCSLICNRECASCLGYPSYCLSCIDGYVYDTNYKRCILICHSSCLSCSYSYSPTSCTSCLSGQYLQNNTCFVCKKGTYSAFDKCLQCLDNCIDCNSGSTCTVCRAGYHLNSSSNSCIQNETETIIVKTLCNYSCATCIDSKYTSCVTCAENRVISYYLFSSIGQCLCPPNYTDNALPACQYSSTQENIQSTNTAIYVSSISTSIIFGVLTSNPVVFIGLVELTQNLSFLTYVNYQSKVGLDSNMSILYASHISNIFDLKSLAPSKENSSLKKGTLRNLIDSDDSLKIDSMQSEYDTLVSPKELQKQGNDKLYLNNKTPYFAVNSLPLVILTIISWILSLCFSKFGLMDKYQSQWKKTLRIFFHKSFPILFFIATFQEISLLVFFQFENFNFDTSLDGFSSLLSIIVLFYLVGMVVYLAYILEYKGLFKNNGNQVQKIDHINIVETKVSQKKNDQNMVKKQKGRLFLKENAVVPLEVVEELKEEEKEQKEQADLKEQFWVLAQYLSHETLSKRIFIFVLLLRKWITCIIYITGYEDGVLQISFLVSLSIIELSYLILSKPFRQVSHCIWYCLFECIILVIQILVLCMLVSNQVDAQVNISLSILSLTVALLVIYLLLTLSTLLIAIRNYCYKQHQSLVQLTSPTKTHSSSTTATNSLYKRSKNILTQIENNKTLHNDRSSLAIYDQYKNLQNESITNQTKQYTSHLNQSVLQLDETQQEIEKNIFSSTQINIKQFLFNRPDTYKLSNNIIFNTNSNNFNQTNNLNSSSERIILLDDSSNLFHFIAPKEKFTIQPIISGLFEDNSAY